MVPFDSIGSKSTPTKVEMGDQALYFKVCQSPYEVTEATDFTKGTCDENSMAFLGYKDGSNYDCNTMFGPPTLEGIKNTNTESHDAYEGFKLHYTAQYEKNDDEKCSNGEPLTVTINAVCQEKGENTF